MNVFSTEHPLTGRPTSFRTRIITASILLVLVAVTVFFIRHINGPRVVARVVASDGTEFCVVQKCNWDFEFFTTSCFYRKPGGPWGWFYYDHEDWYWRRARTELDPVSSRISVYRDGRVTVTFDCEAEQFQLFRLGFPNREFKGAQEWMPLGWSITQNTQR
jgi:hypothetical protein